MTENRDRDVINEMLADWKASEQKRKDHFKSSEEKLTLLDPVRMMRHPDCHEPPRRFGAQSARKQKLR